MEISFRYRNLYERVNNTLLKELTRLHCKLYLPFEFLPQLEQLLFGLRHIQNCYFLAHPMKDRKSYVWCSQRLILLEQHMEQLVL